MTKKWTTWWSRAQRGLGVLNQKAPQHHRIVLTSIPSSQSIRFKFAAYYDTQDIMIENVLCHDSHVSRTVTFHGQSSCQLFPGKDILSDEIQMDSNELTLEYEIVTQEGYNCVSGFEYMDYDPFRQAPKQIYALQSIELFSEELKLAVVQYVLEGHTRKEASEKFCVSCTPIEKWVNLYKLHGAKGLLSRNLVGRQKGFDGEFRLKVLQYKQEHHLSCTQTAMHFCLDVVTVCRWEKKFQKEGARGLMKKQATKGSEKRQKKQEQSELQQENKRLSEENYRLRMECVCQ